MSLKSLASKGLAKKTDLYRVRHADLKVEQGFNLRNLHKPEIQDHINSIFQTIKNGGEVPPLEVRTDEDDNVWIVDGHCRHAAFDLAIKDGCPIEYINVLPFKGNDAERVAKMITSSQGKSLSPLEMGLGYRRLEKFNWDETKIAASVGKSSEQVKQLLILAHANTDVQMHVESEAISAYAAIDLIKKYGEKAGAYITEQLNAAQANGKTKVTKAGMHGRALPKKIVSGLVSSVASFAERLDSTTRRELAELENTPEDQLEGRMVQVSAAAMLSLLRAQSAIDEIKAKQNEKTRNKEQAGRQAAMAV